MRGWLTAFGLVAASCSIASAQTLERAPPPPQGKSESAIGRWEKDYISLDGGWSQVSFDDDGIFYVSFNAVSKASSEGTIRAWVRRENFRPDAGTRSDRVLTEFDCDARRLKYLAVDNYLYNNMQGEANSADEPNASWTFARPSTHAEHQLKYVCEKLEEYISERGEGSSTTQSVEWGEWKTK